MVVKSDVKRERHRTKNGSYTVYIADISYRYDYKGKTYDSGRTAFIEEEYSSSAAAQRVVNANPPGKKIYCLMDPQRPSRAVLTRKIVWKALLLGGVVSTVFLGFALFMGVQALRRR